MATYPTDPLFNAQWHLTNSAEGEFDLNIVDVWDDYTGDGIEIAVLEPGIERDHPDLIANYSNYKDWDFANNDTNVSNGDSDRHGTSVTGIIAATANNDIGGVGIAYDSTVFGLGISGSQRSTYSTALNNASGQSETESRNREADIVNMSFGSSGYFSNRSSINTVAFIAALDTTAEIGRNGLGTILVKSAGNYRKNNVETNHEAADANTHMIVVANVDRTGAIAASSSYGSSVLVSAFGQSILTTDMTGTGGREEGDYTIESPVNGTSFSAPMVSGIAALMLDANPNLGWRDVQEILSYSARQVGSEVGAGISGSEKYAWSFNGANNWNGGGLHFSNDYGFGLVDAKAAVRLAETWDGPAQTSANQETTSTDFLNTTTTISTSGTAFSQAINTSLTLEHVEVDVRFTEWYDLGDLDLRLTSPSGTTSILIDNAGEDDGTADGGFGSGRWTFTSNAFRGEDSAGTWTLLFDDGDDASVSPITIDDIDIAFRGQAASDDDTFIFTREYSDYAGQFGHTTAISGGNGIDTLNAAAVDSATTINLSTGRGQIDGVETTMSGIERVVTGDGDDLLTGDDGNNQLQGMRGNDQLVGNGGDDGLDGGRGLDTAVFRGDRAYFAVTETSDSELQIVDQRGIEGSDRLLNIEQFEFTDGTYDRASLLTQFSISGTVFNDINGLADNTVNGTGINALGGQPLYAYLVDDASNLSVRRTPVDADGRYTFTNIAGNIAYDVEISTDVLNVGELSPLYVDGANGARVNLPDGFELTGEFDPESRTVDTTPAGNIDLALLAQNITNVNFGLRRINTAPDAVNDTGTTPANTALPLDVLANDTDADADPLTIIQVSAPTSGTAEMINGQLVYTPNPDFSGNDLFDYTVSDGYGGIDTAQVTVTVEPEPTAPTLPNLIDNGGFETGMTAWNNRNGTATLTPDAVGGDGALALAAGGSGISQRFDIVPGATYGLTSYAKASGTGWSGIGITFYDANWNALERGSTSINTSAWTSYEMDATAPENALRATVWAWNSSPEGTTILDEVTVSVLDTPPETNELLNNAGFENGLVNWTGSTGTESLTDDAIVGTQALRLRDDRSGMRQSVKVVPGDTYQLTGYAKTDSAAWSGVGVNFFDAEWNRLDSTAVRINSADWAQYQLDYTAPVGAVNATVWSGKRGDTGTTYLDELSFQSLTGD